MALCVDKRHDFFGGEVLWHTKSLKLNQNEGQLVSDEKSKEHAYDLKSKGQKDMIQMKCSTRRAFEKV